LDRYLSSQEYGYSLARSDEFKSSREALMAKGRQLRKEGKGRKPNRAQSISDEEETVTIFSIIHTLRYIMYFHN